MAVRNGATIKPSFLDLLLVLSENQEIRPSSPKLKPTVC